MSISLICVFLLALLCILLGFNVTRLRGAEETLYGVKEDPENALYKAYRAHANTAEYAPIFALLIYILGQSPQPAWVIWFMVLATASRYLIALGIAVPVTMNKLNPVRLIGALGTYLFGLGLCVALLLQAL